MSKRTHVNIYRVNKNKDAPNSPSSSSLVFLEVSIALVDFALSNLLKGRGGVDAIGISFALLLQNVEDFCDERLIDFLCDEHPPSDEGLMMMGVMVGACV